MALRFYFKFTIIASFLVFGPAALANQQDCTDQVGKCQYYECLNQQLNCGPDSFLLNTAAYYCHQYDEKLDQFSPQGQVVVSQLKLCLQQQVQQVPSLTCESVTSKFFDAHVTCYVQRGFCKLSLSDQFLIGKIGGLALLKSGGREAASEIVRRCAALQPAVADGFF